MKTGRVGYQHSDQINLDENNFSLESVLYINEDKYVIYGGLEELIYNFDTKKLHLRMKIALKEKVNSILKSKMKRYSVYIGKMNGFLKCFESKSEGEEMLIEKMAGIVITSLYFSTNDKFVNTGLIE